jgi:copper chaperone NosL
MKRRAAVVPALWWIACAAGAPAPARLDTRNEACATCRMAVSEARFASQIAVPDEVPRFFDDLGCLASYLKARQVPAGTAIFVTDHRSRAWVPAHTAVYTRVPTIATPMGSHLIAHADAASRDQDAQARGGTPVTGVEVVGANGLTRQGRQ